MFKKLVNFGHSKLALLDEHTLEVVKKSFSSTIVKVVGMIIGLGISVFLGRTIGAEGLGIINLSNRVVNILLVVGLLGMRQVIIKEVAIAHNKKDYAHIGNVMHTAYWLNGGITLALTVIVILITPWLTNNIFHEPRLKWPLIIGLIVTVPQIFSRIFSSALVGYRKIWQSNLVENALSSAVTGLLILILWLFKQEITVYKVAVIYAIGRIVVTISVGTYWNSIYNYKAKHQKITKQLLRTALPLLVVTFSGMIMTNADTIVLGALLNTKDVGLYSVAARLALLTSFFLQVSNAAISPKLAALYESGQIKELEKMVQQVTKGLGIIGILPFIIYLILGKYILNIWGLEFIGAYWILLILSLGQFVNLATGAVGLILIMTGHERIHERISLFAVCLTLFLVYILTLKFGAIGTAIAVATTIIFENLAKLFFVKRNVKISVIKLIR